MIEESCSGSLENQTTLVERREMGNVPTHGEEPNARILNVAAYKFVSLDRLSQRRHLLKAACDRASLRGTILLSREGINLFIAGPERPLREFLRSLTDDPNYGGPEFDGLEVKESWSDEQPFNRMLVRLKREIISMGVDEVQPAVRTSPKLTARELRQWLDEGREVTLLDVRNDYEVSVGTFENAVPIGIDHFRHFPEAVGSLPSDLKAKPIVMFCTGGIRCEKAGPFMEQQGFREIYQLDGGILKYFEECGGSHYQGDCFVFDKRVALTPQLTASGLRMCYACQAILTPRECESPLFVEDVSCPRCYREPEGQLRSLAERNAAIAQLCRVLPGSIPYDNVRPVRIPAHLTGETLGAALRHLLPRYGQEYWDAEFAAGNLRLGDRVVGPDAIVSAGQRYGHWFPQTVEPDVSPEIDVIYEDDALVVVNKPSPLPMHPCGRFNKNTLVWILREALQIPGLRPVHRLDANTTGVAVFAKTRAVAGAVQKQFDGPGVKKVYLVHCAGEPSWEEHTCRIPISKTRAGAGGRELLDRTALADATDGDESVDVAADESAGKNFGIDSGMDSGMLDAETVFRRISLLPDLTALLEARPITGRTNQIRIHLWHLQMPVVGDPMYCAGGKVVFSQTLDVEAAKRFPMRLHAWRIELLHPMKQEPLTLEATPPPWATEALELASATK